MQFKALLEVETGQVADPWLKAKHRVVLCCFDFHTQAEKHGRKSLSRTGYLSKFQSRGKSGSISKRALLRPSLLQ